MKTTHISISRIDRMIDRLENAIQVCYTAPEKSDQGYPYAAGYSRSCMQETVQQLKELLKNENGDQC
jgi:hypothetical protein